MRASASPLSRSMGWVARGSRRRLLRAWQWSSGLLTFEATFAFTVVTAR